MQPHREAHAKPTKVLLVTTKFPWPTVDGGRLLVAKTLAALDPSAAQVVLAGPWHVSDGAADQLARECPAVTVAPCCRNSDAPARAPGLLERLLSTLRALWRGAAATVGLGGLPLTALRHHYPACVAALKRLIDSTGFDLIHCEQPHAFGCLPRTQLPILLRAQNVEADLWRRYAESTSGLTRWFLLGQARAVRRWERCIALRATAVVAISAEDRSSFAELVPELDPVLHHLPPAFGCTETPPTDRASGLEGGPAVVLFAGSQWQPNRVGLDRFFELFWPAMHAATPTARLHAFGTGGQGSGPIRPDGGVIRRPAPAASEHALLPGAVLAVPALVTSGIRMKILEAISRGMVVITTNAGARGLGPGLRSAVLLANTAEEWAGQIERCNDASFMRQQQALGQAALASEHDPPAVGHQLAQLYREVAARDRGAPHRGRSTS